MKTTTLISVFVSLALVIVFFSSAPGAQEENSIKKQAYDGRKESATVKATAQLLNYRGPIIPVMFALTAINTATNRPVTIKIAIPDIPGDMSQLSFGIVLSKKGTGDFPANYDPYTSIDMIEPAKASKWRLYEVSGRQISPRKPFNAEVVLKLKKGSKSVWEVQNITEIAEHVMTPEAK
jgi:hypothetical protein